jgi:regulator of sirC expression with transglutaminase-like and TPR domain
MAEASAELASLLRTPKPPLGDCLLILSSILGHRPDALDVGRDHLDELALGIEEATIPGIVRHLFGRNGFRGDIEDYHAESNSFLDQVLERRVGMPITLSAVVTEVGARVGVELQLIGMPGHVIVGVPGDDQRFIDAFSGIELDAIGVRRRFESIFGTEAHLPPRALQPLDPIAVVNRVCNNLTRTWSNTDSQKLNRLLDLRAELPASETEQRLLIDISEARGRFDLAARLRSQLDPDDPNIEALWARLN